MTSNTAKGTAYEKFVQSIYQTLHDADGFDDVVVQHNKTDLVGRSGCAHQLDIYWEFSIAGVKYCTAIECKAFDKTVSIGRVRDFYGVLADNPSLQGMFVSLFGFQSGAKKYAEYYNIGLKEIRPPSSDDWDGRIKDIHLRYFIVSPEIKGIYPNITSKFMQNLKPNEKVDASFSGSTFDAYIVTENGDIVASLEEIRQKLTAGVKPSIGLEETLQFSKGYINASSGQRIPIDSITVTYDVHVEVQQADIFGENVAKAIMKDVKSGEFTVFHENGELHNPRATKSK